MTPSVFASLAIVFSLAAALPYGPNPTTTTSSTTTPSGPQPTLFSPGVSEAASAPPNWLVHSTYADQTGSLFVLTGNATNYDPSTYLFKYTGNGILASKFKIQAPNAVGSGGVAVLSNGAISWAVTNVALTPGVGTYQYRITAFNLTSDAQLFDTIVPLKTTFQNTSQNSVSSFASFDSLGSLYVTGSALYVGSDYGTLTVKISKAGQIVWTQSISTGYPTGISLSPDEKFIAVSGISGVRVYDSTTGADITSVKAYEQYAKYPYTLSYTSTGSLIVGNNFETYLESSKGELLASSSKSLGVIVKPILNSASNDVVSTSIGTSGTSDMFASIQYTTWASNAAAVKWSYSLAVGTTTVNVFVDTMFVYWVVASSNSFYLRKYSVDGTLQLTQKVTLPDTGDSATSAAFSSGSVFVATIKGWVYKF